MGGLGEFVYTGKPDMFLTENVKYNILKAGGKIPPIINDYDVLPVVRKDNFYLIVTKTAVLLNHRP